MVLGPPTTVTTKVLNSSAQKRLSWGSHEECIEVCQMGKENILSRKDNTHTRKGLRKNQVSIRKLQIIWHD